MEIHRHQEHPHSVEGGEHHEKKPVLKKVKDKVKKIKETISKKRHGHSDDEQEHHEHDNDVSEEEEGYEEDEEEMEVDPEVHGAPMYESAASRNLVGGRDENLGPVKVSLGEAMEIPVEEDPAAAKKSDKSQLLYPSAAETTADERQNLVRDKDQYIDPEKVSLMAVARSVEEDPAAPKGRTGTSAAATELGNPSYSPVKGGDEVGESPLLSSFQAMAVSDKPKGQQDVLETPPTGTRDHFSPEKLQQENANEQTEERESSSYTDKISSTAVAAKDAAVSAAIGSTEYGKKIASTVYDKASTVYDKVSGAGTAIVGKGTIESQQDVTKPGQPSDKGVSVKEYIVGKLRPGDGDRALSEVISDAIHSKKQEVMGTPETKGLPSEGNGGKGMVDKIKGAVTSWIGAGTAGGPRALPRSTNLDTEEKEAVTGQAGSQKWEEKME